MRRFYLLLTIIVTLPIYGNVTIDDGNGEIIQFADPQVKTLCVSKWDTNGDGELSKAEAAAVEGIKNDEFKGTTITSFDELKYFTSLYYVQGFTDCSNLESISLPAYCMSIYPSAFQGCI